MNPTRRQAVPWLFLSVALGSAMGAAAEPSFGGQQRAGTLHVYPDAKDGLTFYYSPGALRLGEDPPGIPDLRFLQMIYAGTSATDDAGKLIARSVLSFRIEHEHLSDADLRAAEKALPAGARLRALPIQRIETHLVWTPIGPDAAPPRQLGTGRLDEGEADRPASEGDWTERTFILTPDPLSSQLLWAAFQRGRVLLSLGYAVYARGVRGRAGELTAPADFLPSDAGVVDPSGAGKLEERVIASGALEIVADAARRPDRFRRIDLNQNIPPGFAVLEVRCYDFNNALRPDLVVKKVEVRAAAAGGRTALQSATFRASAPDVAAVNLRFAQAVRLDRPFRWRTIEVARDGNVNVGPWTERADWVPVLDVTTAPKEEAESAAKLEQVL
jgi:hypothetical protein